MELQLCLPVRSNAALYATGQRQQLFDRHEQPVLLLAAFERRWYRDAASVLARQPHIGRGSVMHNIMPNVTELIRNIKVKLQIKIDEIPGNF